MTAPRHLAVIPDGNRRWARSVGRPASEGHHVGIDNVSTVAAAAFDAGVEVFSFWWGSPANLTNRTPAEVEVITGVLNRWLTERAPELLRAWDARFSVYGRWAELCPEITPGVEAARSASGSGPRRLVLLMGYDGRDELLDAVSSGPTTLEELRSKLWTGDLPPVDLVLRTAGEPHLSAGFLLWHIAEAQLAFVDPPWPAFTTEDLAEVLDGFGRTERRFGV